MSETTGTGVITVAPKSSGFSALNGAEIDDEESQRRVQQQPEPDCPTYFCTQVCVEPCGDMCAEIIRLLCCFKCWSDLSSAGEASSNCCCCEDCDCCCGGDCCGDCGECCGNCGDCGDCGGFGDLCGVCCCDG